MLLETLLTATLETAIGLLAEVGFGDELRDLKARLAKSNERKRQAAFDVAFAKAKRALPDEAVQALLNHRPFQEAIINGLLDPVTGFDVQAAATEWIEKYPEWARPLRRFFDALDNALLEDSEWGPVLERFHELRARRETQAALKERQLDLAPREITRQVFNTLSVGAGGIAAGGNVSQIIIQQLILQSGGSPNLGDLRKNYLARLLKRCHALPLPALGGRVDSERPITLDQVYIDLNTTVRLTKESLEKLQNGDLTIWTQTREARGEIDGRILGEMGEHIFELKGRKSSGRTPLPALDTLRLASRLVYLGDPGAGKSTFVRMVISLLCEGHPPPGLPGELLPILIVLRDLAPRLAAIDFDKLPGEKHEAALAEAVRDQAVADLAGLEAKEFESALVEALNSGRCLLVLDGLDEVPPEQRGLVRRAVAAVAARYAIQQFIVTCRVRSYSGEAILPDFESFTLAPFNQEQITNFAHAWYDEQLGAVDVGLAKNKADDLARVALGDDLRELSQNPMLLTTMAVIHTTDVTLPKERVRLYSRAVDILLSRWHKEKVAVEKLDAFLKDERKLRAVIERLAYAAHSLKGQDKRKEADLPRPLAREILEGQDCLGDANIALQFLDYVDQRAGLLLGRGGEPGRPAEYTFPHRTFQEYLAGCYLLTGSDADRVRAFYARAAEGDTWNLAASLGAEELLYNTRNGERQLLHLAYNLLANDLMPEQNQRAALWAGQMAALIGRESVERDEAPVGGPVYLGRLRGQLVTLLSSTLTPPERAEAGRALARLGDPRPEVMTVEAMPFCFVPAGPFWMGSNQEEIKDVGEIISESPRRQVTLPDYFIARYSVTQAQFAEFVEAGGYKEARYWLEAKRAEVWRDGRIHLKWANEGRDRPFDFGEPFNLPNHPVLGVTWYEALAFARWLTDRWRSRLPAGWEVRLPTEAQWEKAARGSLQVPAMNQIVSPAQGFGALASQIELKPNANPIRQYTWEGEWEQNRANTYEAAIETTSAVGCFPAGISPYSVEEMIGNLWEWCQSKAAKYPYKPDGRETIDAGNDARVFRGGSFYNDRSNARCACRGNVFSGNFGNGIGFRLVISPGQGNARR